MPARLPCPWVFPGKNIGAGCHFLPVFLTRVSNTCLLYCYAKEHTTCFFFFFFQKFNCFRSYIQVTFHVELTFMFILRYGSVLFFAYAVRFSKHDSLKRLSIPHCVCLAPCDITFNSSVKWPYRCGFIMGCQFCSIDPCVYFYASAILLWLL